MAKPAQKSNRTFLYVGLAAVGIAGFILTSPPETGKVGGKLRKPTKKVTSKTADVFTKEDETAVFTRLNDSAKNSFKPLIVRDDALGAGATLMPNQIPAAYTGDTGIWTYTGTAIIDEVPQALVESSTGEMDFLKVGQAWKSCRVTRITPTSLTLSGPNGMVRTMELLADPVVPDFGGIGVEPINPMRGPVDGRGASLRAQSGTPGSGENNERLDAN